MFNVLIWCVYGIFVGSIAKSLVPGEENFGFVKTVALGVVGSYAGGALCYMMGQYNSLEPSGIFMGVVGSVIAIIVYNKLNQR